MVHKHSILSKFAILVPAVLFLTGLSSDKVQAQVKDYWYDKVDVDITINQDSTFDVIENLTYHFQGEYHAVYREITLFDEQKTAKCLANNDLQCGGFSFVKVGNVYGDGKLLNPNQYTIEEVIDDSGQKRLKVQWIFSEAGRYFNNEKLEFKLEYKVYGGVGYFEQDDYQLFYWNTFAEDRDKIVKKLNVNVDFPKNIDLSSEDFTVYGYDSFDYNWQYDADQASLNLTNQNLPAYESFTVGIKMPWNTVDRYATLVLDTSPKTLDLKFNDIELKNIKDNLSGLPAGTYQITFAASGYQSQQISVTVKSGEFKVIDLKLKPSLFTIIRYVLIVLCNAFGCLLLPLGLLWIYKNWKTKGQDLGRQSTIVPIYSPPDQINPYLLGSLKDEKVDLVDITATLIDVAYRGYIKIKEYEAKTVLGFQVKAKDYELTKVKEFTDLNASEQRILTDIFGASDRVTTSSLQNKFYSKIPSITQKIYEEMVEKKLFDQNPDKVRKSYGGKAAGLIAIGVILIPVSTFFIGIGLPITFTTISSTIVLGIVLAIVAGHMPAKTTLGSKLFAQILGFKMYMQTAERFRVQNLTPETFEKYLSYAMVFGIEKQWAEKFKDIYKSQPDWYEGNYSTWNTFMFADMMRSFTNSTTQSLVSSPSSSSSSSFSGGGWSGGGGFSGGFSGGGGGGGGSGAW